MVVPLCKLIKGDPAIDSISKNPNLNVLCEQMRQIVHIVVSSSVPDVQSECHLGSVLRIDGCFLDEILYHVRSHIRLSLLRRVVHVGSDYTSFTHLLIAHDDNLCILFLLIEVEVIWAWFLRRSVVRLASPSWPAHSSVSVSHDDV